MATGRGGRGRIGPWRALLPVVWVVAGVLFGTSASVSQGTDLRPGPADLADVIRGQTQRVEAQAKAVQQLRDQVDALTAEAAPGNRSVKKLQNQIDDLAPTVGTEAVTGPGISVTLDDAHRDAASLPEGYTADDIVVHQQDVQGVVNALWSGGAEAMMLMDQRVIATSAVRCVGNTLILQGRVYSPPFTIKAIGDVQGMQQALDTSQSVSIYREYVDLLGLGYQVDQSHLTFPAYEGSLELGHAQAAR
ncbi:DUF881 domain-containing protein [Segeticoccus rhizosphaerae]|jgi:uncharacterized protein YlxW (UPF0749 family)|uniref:DUF881 domain-containing protein n=1 Tax=Segeticoccus rhizosphaerae TaxID=1104777 RepID=UPI0010C109C9|nr:MULTISPECIES: DUF881 domain-containing protein [Intrasporangiaceae]